MAVESKILSNLAESLEIPLTGDIQNFIENLCKWSDIVRKTFYDGGIDEIISTRRLVHIIRAYKIFGDRVKAIKMCMNRFDAEIKQTFLELYEKIDAEVEIS